MDANRAPTHNHNQNNNNNNNNKSRKRKAKCKYDIDNQELSSQTSGIHNNLSNIVTYGNTGVMLTGNDFVNCHRNSENGIMNPRRNLNPSPLSDITNVTDQPFHEISSSTNLRNKEVKSKGRRPTYVVLPNNVGSSCIHDTTFNTTLRNDSLFSAEDDTNLSASSQSYGGLSSNPDKEIIKRTRGRPVKYRFAENEIAANKTPTSNLSSVSLNELVIDKFKGISGDYIDIGNPIYVCTACQALLWKSEAARGNKSFATKKYSLCCLHGKVQLPGLKHPPSYLLDLYRGRSTKSKNFIENIRRYNMMFSFTSMGGKIDHKVNCGGAPYVYRMYGQNYHLAGSLLPDEGQDAKFCQLYIYDTANESDNRIKAYRYRNDIRSNPYSIETSIVNEIKGLLDEINPLVKKFRMARDRFQMSPDDPIRIKLIGTRDTDGRIHNLPTANEVAALIVGDLDGTADHRDIILQKRSKEFKRINELHVNYLALQYPLLFPYAEDGYRTDVLHRGVEGIDESGYVKLTIREFFSYRLQMRVCEVSLILLSRKLLQQFIVDAYTMVENTRLNYIRNNQTILRVSTYTHLFDAHEAGNDEAADIGNRVVLPSTFTGGPRYLQQMYLDAMAIVRTFGHPDLFLTFTCNPKWPEILRFLSDENLNPEDRPDIISRVFKMKLDSLIFQLKDKKMFGKTNAVVYRIEFQKRGLPHAHICLFLDKKDKIPTRHDIDQIISAEIPDKEVDPDVYAIVSEFMMHGPCGQDNPKCPCMRRGKCSKHFPKDFTKETYFDGDGYPRYKRRSDGNYVMKSKTKLDNRSVVPYNKQLIKQYQAHLNVEWCNQFGSIKYLFKYINKGPDRISISIEDQRNSNAKQSKKKSKDEIENYYSCRYISACEATWRLFNYEIVYRTPAVYRLSFHLPGHEPIFFDAHDDVESVLSKPTVGSSQFTEWMNRNRIDENARQYTYVEFPRHYVWNVGPRTWTPRKSRTTVGRINYVSPKFGETYFLRILLNKVRGPTSYKDIRTFNDTVYNTFKDACFARGLLEDDREYVSSIKETHFWATGNQCRDLFVALITTDSLSFPDRVWKATRDMLSDDLHHECPERLRIIGGSELNNVLYNIALSKIERSLNSSGYSLKNILNMPYPDLDYLNRSCNMLIQDEMSYDLEVLGQEHENSFTSMTDEQLGVYNQIIDAVDKDEGGMYFLYGYGGTGKTYLWKTLSAAVRLRGEIVINVASSGIAALLLSGGRTAHSRFAIPINVVEDSFCFIQPESELAALLNKTKLIIWDEAPMIHRHCVEAFDRTMRDIIRSQNSHKPFGGKVVVFGGDFRQILPVVSRGTRPEIVNASLHSSMLWRNCNVLKLTKNMRLLNRVTTSEKEDVNQFANWILKIGEGKINLPNDGEADVQIPDDVLLHVENNNPIETIVQSTYSSLHQNLGNPTYFQDRAILAPKNDVVASINEFILSTIDRPERVYYSSDTLCPDEIDDEFTQQLYAPEILNDMKIPGVPNHRLSLKTGVPIMLLRNVDQAKGLCNGTRLLVERMAENTIEARIITGHSFGNLTYIPRMVIEPTDKSIAIKFRRRQFPVTVCFAMTINKSQGQSLQKVGLYLEKPVFSHGQLYVALSRVTSKKGLKVLIMDDEGNETNTTKNVVFKEVLQSVK